MTDPVPSNVGHGHVFPRPDGVKARCGGPALCHVCAADLARKNIAAEVKADPVPSKEEVLASFERIAQDIATQLAVEVNRLGKENERLREDCRRWENAHKILLADNERLRKQVGELSTHAEKWVKRATTPAHEREAPHCSTCACGMAVHAPLTDAEIDAIANEGHRNAAGGIYATSVYEFARAIESRAAQPPRDGQ